MNSLSIALIYLVAALIAVPIARRLGLSSVLGYLIAGAVIGPFGLTLVGDQTAVMRFAEYGVVVMLFLIGLELKIEELWRLRMQIFGVGLAQMVITTAVIAFGVHYFVDHTQTAIAIGLILAPSSTALVLETYREKGWGNLEGGKMGFATLLFQDIAIIPIIIGLPLLAVTDPALLTSFTGVDAGLVGADAVSSGLVDGLVDGLADGLASEGNGPGGESSHGGGHGELAPIWVVASAIISLVVAGRYLVRPAFRIVASSGSSELFTVAALAIVVSVTMLMEQIGLSPALGGFLAGVVLAENEYRHEIESDLEPFRGILLGLFFLTVGASLDIPTFLNEPFVILAAVAALITAKAIVAYFIAFGARLKSHSRGIYAFSLAQGSEFAFVLFGLAVSAGVIDSLWSERLLIVVTFSMLFSPFVILGFEKLAARRNVVQDAQNDLPEKGDVIIAGFGRFGQVITRLLKAEGYHTVVLDYDASQVETVRRFGSAVFFGDASRVDLLRAAGAEEAKLIVVAVDVPAKSLEIIENVQKHFPSLKIVARARNRQHAYELIRRNVTVFERETFVSALELGVKTLEYLGHSKHHARRVAAKFRAYDEQMLVELEKLWGDNRAYGLAVNRSLDTLRETLAQDEAEFGEASKMNISPDILGDILADGSEENIEEISEKGPVTKKI